MKKQLNIIYKDFVECNNLFKYLILIILFFFVIYSCRYKLCACVVCYLLPTVYYTAYSFIFLLF